MSCDNLNFGNAKLEATSCITIYGHCYIAVPGESRAEREEAKQMGSVLEKDLASTCSVAPSFVMRRPYFRAERDEHTKKCPERRCKELGQCRDEFDIQTG